jgi:hypothetical protein
MGNISEGSISGTKIYHFAGTLASKNVFYPGKTSFRRAEG